MGRRRKTRLTLSGTRIYVRRKNYVYYAKEAVLNPKTAKVVKHHILCPVKDGEYRAREILKKITEPLGIAKDEGSFVTWLHKYRDKEMLKRENKAPKDPERKKIWVQSSHSRLSVYNVIEKGFKAFDLDEVLPSDVAVFVDQWEGRRIAQVYRNTLNRFFAWCVRMGLLTVNPAREISVEKPPSRDVYITDKQYRDIHAAVGFTNKGKATRCGGMLQCYMDLLYLLYQRGTDVRLLKWEDVTPEGILFKPTKTEASSGKKVLVPLSDDAKIVLAKAKAIGKKRSPYVIHSEDGEAYTANGIAKLFKIACERLGIENVTLRDIRAKAATDATTEGYSEAQVQVGLAHTDAATTRGYLKRRVTTVSELMMSLPTDAKKEGEEE